MNANLTEAQRRMLRYTARTGKHYNSDQVYRHWMVDPQVSVLRSLVHAKLLTAGKDQWGDPYYTVTEAGYAVLKAEGTYA